MLVAVRHRLIKVDLLSVKINLKGKFLYLSILVGLILLPLLIALVQLALPLNYTQQIVILTYHRVSNKMTEIFSKSISDEATTPLLFLMVMLRNHLFHLAKRPVILTF